MLRMSLLHYWQKTNVEGALRIKYQNWENYLIAFQQIEPLLHIHCMNIH